MPSMPSSPNLLERLLKENSELTERVTSLSQERATFKHRLTCLERQLRRTENELAKVTTETENRPINDVTSSSKVSRKHMNVLTFVMIETMARHWISCPRTDFTRLITAVFSVLLIEFI